MEAQRVKITNPGNQVSLNSGPSLSALFCGHGFELPEDGLGPPVSETCLQATLGLSTAPASHIPASRDFSSAEWCARACVWRVASGVASRSCNEV